MKKKAILLCLLLVVLIVINLTDGTVNIPIHDTLLILKGESTSHTAWEHIIWQNRIPQTITAMFAGSALAVSGLLMQTLFRNPLAGPSILGISDGANLGVAIIMLYFGGNLGLLGAAGGFLTVLMAAMVGAFSILMLIIYFSTKVKNNVMLLIIGIMIGYLTSSIISILNFHASTDKVHAFVMWGMGDFSGVSLQRLPLLIGSIGSGLVLSLLLIKPLNALLLGEQYAENLGVNIRRCRISILLCTGVLTAVTTAFCGPISFIGLAVPHIARLLLGTSNHKQLVPFTILSGAFVALLCNWLCLRLIPDSFIPLNAVTPILGAPVIIYVIINRDNIQYFN